MAVHWHSPAVTIPIADYRSFYEWQLSLKYQELTSQSQGRHHENHRGIKTDQRFNAKGR